MSQQFYDEGGGQLRVLNAIYLHLASTENGGSKQAFANIADYSLKTDPDHKLAVKFLFNNNSSQFDRRDAEYPMGVRQITQRTAIGCLEIEPDWACRSQ